MLHVALQPCWRPASHPAPRNFCLPPFLQAGRGRGSAAGCAARPPCPAPCVRGVAGSGVTGALRLPTVMLLLGYWYFSLPRLLHRRDHSPVFLPPFLPYFSICPNPQRLTELRDRLFCVADSNAAAMEKEVHSLATLAARPPSWTAIPRAASLWLWQRGTLGAMTHTPPPPCHCPVRAGEPSSPEPGAAACHALQAVGLPLHRG